MSQFCHCVVNAINLDNVGRTPATLVPSLLKSCGPATVVRRIRSIVVDAVDAVLRRRTQAYISEKSLKGFSPAFTDSNASASVVRVVRISGIQTPLFHAAPGLVLGCLIATKRGAVRLHSLTPDLTNQTAATTCFPAPQIGHSDDAHDPAVATAACATGLATHQRDLLDDREATVPRPSRNGFLLASTSPRFSLSKAVVRHTANCSTTTQAERASVTIPAWSGLQNGPLPERYSRWDRLASGHRVLRLRVRCQEAPFAFTRGRGLAHYTRDVAGYHPDDRWMVFAYGEEY